MIETPALLTPFPSPSLQLSYYIKRSPPPTRRIGNADIALASWYVRQNRKKGYRARRDQSRDRATRKGESRKANPGVDVSQRLNAMHGKNQKKPTAIYAS
jgi:hypothetical protein